MPKTPASSINSLTDALIKAHTQHELQRIKTRLTEDAHALTKQYLDTVGQYALEDILPEKTLAQWIINIIDNTSINCAFHNAVADMVNHFYTDTSHDERTLSELITDKQIAAYIKHSLSLTEVRERLTESALSSGTYEEFVGDLVLSAIQAYIEESTALTSERVPGAKAVIKMGKGFLQKAAPKLEDKMEEQLRKFIHLIMPELTTKSIHLSNGIPNERLQNVSMNVWHSIKDIPASTARDYLSPKQLEGYVKLNVKQYDHTRQSDYTHHMIRLSFEAFYKSYGQQPLNTLIDDLGITPYLAQWVDEILLAIRPALIESGWLTMFLEARLADFYHSEAAQTILNSAES